MGGERRNSGDGIRGYHTNADEDESSLTLKKCQRTWFSFSPMQCVQPPSSLMAASSGATACLLNSPTETLAHLSTLLSVSYQVQDMGLSAGIIPSDFNEMRDCHDRSCQVVYIQGRRGPARLGGGGDRHCRLTFSV